ncbi:MAG: F0F1 ATP synthase subunit A [Patescibacteria group bacterium]
MIRIEIGAEKLFDLFGVPITNTLVTSWIVVGLLVLASLLFLRQPRRIPSGVQNVFEFFVERFLGLMESVFGSRQAAEQYFPIVATLFLFILISNWLGILPGIGSIILTTDTADGVQNAPLLRSAASDLNFTLALAASSVILVNIAGITAVGLGRHVGKFFSLRGPIDFFVGILELLSEVAKMISFSFRLFGNIFAGEVLLVITAFLAPYLVPVPFLGLELFVGFIQAFVFAMLTMVFISIAVHHH